MKHFSFILLAFLLGMQLQAEIVPAGSGSYTTTFPGKDEANRNLVPAGTPNLTGNAAGKPVPTNDWWSSLICNNFVNNVYNYPFGLRTHQNGLVISNVVPNSGPEEYREPMSDIIPLTVGVSGLNVTKASVSDHTDWTVSVDWNNQFNVTIGLAMPFLYFTKASSEKASVDVSVGTVTVQNEMLLITNGQNGANYAVYAPSGSVWEQNGTTYTSDLNGKNYWSLLFIHSSSGNVTDIANECQKYAYVFPSDTEITWVYNEQTSVVRTTFTVTPDVKEGSDSNVLLGLLPHQWGYLASDSPRPEEHAFPTVRGEVKTLDGNQFFVENKFYGILPTLPNVVSESSRYDLSAMNQKIAVHEDDIMETWTDSYNEGQIFNQLIQTARVADQVGNTVARDKIIETVQERLEDWLTAEDGEVAFLFYYNEDWSALIGYPAGHGQDQYLNDHHFHWGYFIHAAAFVEQYKPGWAAQFGPMIEMLIRDCAGTDRDDPMFPYLRNFSPYAGHSWANGFATFPFGNDQESTSESMQFNSSLIHWGTITGNKEIRDLGIYLYTTEETAINEYWLDVNERNFQPEYKYSLVSRIWGNGYDRQTFWTTDICATYGIELYPIHGGSMYLGRNQLYAKKLWSEMTVNTPVLQNERNDNLWYDIYWEFLAFTDPEKAVELYYSYPNRDIKFGVSDTQTYYWLHAMNVLGRLDSNTTADYPITAVFLKDGVKTYAVHNYNNTPLTVKFSDGHQMTVAANKMEVTKSNYTETPPTVTLTSPAPNSTFEARTAITLTAEAEATDGEILYVEYFKNNEKIGESNTAPYEVTWRATEGAHVLTARATDTNGLSANSEGINIIVNGSSNPSGPCEGNGFFVNEEGVVQTNYVYSFETVETGVQVNIEYSGGTRQIEHVYMHDYTNGFRELKMEATNNVYGYLLNDYQEDGEELTIVIKCIYMGGGDAFTDELKYTVGENCAPSAIPGIDENKMSLIRADKILYLTGVDTPCNILLFDVNGKLIKTISSQSESRIALTDQSGVYIVKIISKDGNVVLKGIN